MTEPSSAVAPDRRTAEAAAWAAALEPGPLDPERQARLDTWLAADPRHRGALLRAQAGLRLLAASDGQAAAAEMSVTRRTRRALLAAAVAGMAVAGIGVLVWPAPVVATGVGEIRQVPLADGSSATLDTDTALRPRFTARARGMTVERGRALFRVAHDAERPFTVEAGMVRVRAIGTIFAVDRTRAGAVGVLVAEGAVDVSAAGRRTRLTAGEQARFGATAAPRIGRLSHDAAIRALSWREGRLELDGQTLGEAVAALNRYQHRPIRVADAALASEPLHGGFRTDDPEGFARVAALALGARVRADAEEILLTR